MKLRMVMEKMPSYKKRLLEADMAYLKADIQYQLCEAVENVRGNRSTADKIVNQLRKISSMANTSVEALLGMYDAMAAVDILKYDIMHNETNTVVWIEMDDRYFEVMDTIRKTMPIPLFATGLNKKNIIDKLGKECRKTYTKRMTLEEHS